MFERPGREGCWPKLPARLPCLSEHHVLVWAPRSCLGTTFMWRTAVLVRDRVSAHRKRLRSHGLRPVQMWGPDVRGDDVATQARRQAKAVARSSTTSDDQELVAAISARWDALGAYGAPTW